MSISQSVAINVAINDNIANAQSIPIASETDEKYSKISMNLDEDIQETSEYFEWKDVNVTIEGKPILRNISGRVGNGQLLGILGGSGAGKTTLLNAISGRILNKKPSTISKIYNCVKRKKAPIMNTGIEVNGIVAYNELSYKLGNRDDIKYLSAYVMQENIQCATSTAKEALLFSSKLRSTASMEQQLETINSVIHALKLEDCENTRIGSEFVKGMSGGEKKRTSVACELVVNPSLIFLDEPTSGLDSFTALRTLEILKNLVSTQNKTVIAVIHQPSSDIFAMLDKLVILSKGHCVYYGDSTDVVKYFNNLGFLCPQFSNPADYVINRVQENNDFFTNSWKQCEKKYIDLNFSLYNKLIPKKPKYAGFCVQFIELLKREWSILMRDPRPSKIRLVQTIVFSLAVGVLYYKLPYTPIGMKNRFGAIFFLTINSSMTGLTATITTFPEQRILYEREKDNNMYYTTTYIMSKYLIQLPEQALFVLIYELIVYWMVGLDSSFIDVYISIILCVTCTASIGMIAGCFANNTTEAMQFLPLALLPLILMANFMVSLDQIPAWIRWFQWLDPFKYVVDCMSITEFKHQKHDCLVDIDSGKYICLYDGDLYLKELDAGYVNAAFLKQWIKSYDDSVYFDWIMLFVLMLFFRFLTWLILVRRNGW